MNSNDIAGSVPDRSSAMQPQLWVGFVDEFPVELRDWAYRELLSDEERARHDRYRHERDRLLHLTARLMTRAALSGLVPEVSPLAWKFRPGPHGKPEIAGPEMQSGRWHFNVTHTEGVVVLALAEGFPVGVDIERIDRPSNFEGLARRFFAAEEAAAIEAAAESERAKLFYRIWTLKEAYVKAIGKGLAHPLDAFWFDPPDRFEPAPRLVVKAGEGDSRYDPSWHASVTRVGPGREWVVSTVAPARSCAWTPRPFRFEEAIAAVRSRLETA